MWKNSMAGRHERDRLPAGRKLISWLWPRLNNDRGEMNGVLIWGLVIGLPAGFLLNLWLNQRGLFPTPFWTRFARIKDPSSFDLQFMFKEMQQKIEDLARETARIDAGLQDLQAKMFRAENMFPAGEFSAGAVSQNKAGAVSTPDGNRLPVAGQPLKVLQHREEIYRLYQAGQSLAEIAQQLKIRQGEIELVLSLKEYKE